MRRELFSGLVLMAMMFAACSDDLGHSPKYDDGFLHFNLLFNSSPESCWKEDGKNDSGTRCEAPIELTSTDLPDLKLYLHTEISDQIDLPAPVAEPGSSNGETRGQRYTGEVFPSISTFGVYGKVGSKVVMDFERFSLDSYETEGDFKVKEKTFGEDVFWLDSEKGNFYAYAPDQADVAGITASLDGTTPILSYTMPTSEADHKDVLAANAENVTRNTKATNGVELEFSHILSAIKFGGTNSEGITWNAGGKTYTLVISKIKIQDVYKTNTYDLTSKSWATLSTSSPTGSCLVTTLSSDRSTAKTDPTGNTSKTYYNINGDDHCLMMLPQTTPSTAKILFECDVYEGTDRTTKLHDVNLEVSFSGKTWLPGHTYTYKLSDTDLNYYFNVSPTDLTFPAMGGTQTFTVKSFVYAPGDDASDPRAAIPTNWHPEYTEGGVKKYGLPVGYALYYNDDTPVPDNLINGVDAPGLKGSVTGETYKLVAHMRLDANNPETNSLRGVVENTAYDTFTKDNPYDLSTKGGTTTRNTANCYVVDGPGYFKFPLVYGNAIKNGQDNKYAYTERKANSYEKEDDDKYQIFVNYLNNPIETPYIVDDVKNDVGTKVPSIYTKLSDAVEAAIVWQDEKNIVSEETLEVFEETDATLGTLGFVKFNISKNHIKNGNAIICLREKEITPETYTIYDGASAKSTVFNNKRILWSWHIWVTDIKLSADIVTVYKNDSDPTKQHPIQFTQNNMGWRKPYSQDYGSQSSPITITVQQNNSTNSSAITAKYDKGVVTISGSNLYYQHGRKDPMPASYKTDNGEKIVDLATEIYKLGYCNDWWLYTEHANRSILAKGAVTIGRGIQHPYHLYAAGTLDWVSIEVEETDVDSKQAGYEYAGRWDPMKAGDYIHTAHITSYADRNVPSAYSHIKTIYDPCPYGYAVPPSAAYELLVYGWKTSSSSVIVNPGERYEEFSGPGGSLRFYKMGWRVHNNGGRVEHFGPPASGTNIYYGYYWTAGVCNNGIHQGWMLEIDNSDNCRPYSYCRNHTNSIRPVVDNESDATNGVIPKIIAAGHGF